jgi:hypothetical protein
MNWSGINWVKIEKIALYLSLSIFSIYQALSLPFPKILDIFPTQTPQMFLAISLLLSIHYLIRLIEAPKDNAVFRVHRSFSEAVQEWLEPMEQLNELYIIALTSNSYLEHIRIQPRPIRKVRLLLLYHEDEALQETEARSVKSTLTLEQAVGGWKLLVTSKKIRKLEIKQLNSNATFYLSIADKQRALCGFLWPRLGSSGVEPREAVTFSKDHVQSRVFLAYAIEWFESVWETAATVPIPEEY